MHNNYYFLKQLTPVIERKLGGMHLAACFSQSKDELIIGFASLHEEFYIRALLSAEFCCLTFPQSFARARRNSVDLFKGAVNKKVLRVQQYVNERCFAIHLESHLSLLFKMHGNRANVILLEKSIVISIFRSNLRKDYSIDPNVLDRPIVQDFQAFVDADCKYEQLFPTFNKTMHNHIRKAILDKESCEQQWNVIQAMLDQLNHSAFYISEVDSELIFSLLPIGKVKHQYDDQITAINHFYQLYTGTYYLEKEKFQIAKILEKRKSQTTNYLLKATDKLDELTTSSKNEQTANIIMANLHLKSEGTEEVELYDFYNSQTIKVKVKRGQSLQKLAEQYYRKVKNQKVEIDRIKENIAAKENLLVNIEEHIHNIQALEDIKTLRNYIKENQIQKEFKEDEESLPFKELHFEGYQILIGKNAKSNDVILQKFSKKNDLWLHAKDSSGSHVIIKERAGQNFPKKVIEKAAEIAAFHSKQRNDTFCPVIYTPRKWVRKIKGAAPGAVIVDKENVILVKPSNIG